MTDALECSREVRAALVEHRAVVALESTLVTHGLPPPHNLAAARSAERAVREEGAIPATVAIHAGRIRVGLVDDELAALAAETEPLKVTRQNLAAALARSGWSGTTVSATMIAADRAGISTFATGGIGGVHMGGEDSLDVSADLDELARTPVAVVCAGPKSILDVPRTLEVLETRGVPVVGWGTNELPGFFSVGSGITIDVRVDSPEEAAALCRRHWGLGLASGLLFTVPAPREAALPDGVARQAIIDAIAAADREGIHGPATTPWVLTRVAELTDGRSIVANLALIEQNARIAARIATALAGPG